MKVICEYCGCYVETDENTRCPHCVAELGSSIKAEKERQAKEEEAARQREAEVHQREAEAKAKEAQEEHVSEIIQGLAGVATAVVTGIATAKETKQQQAATKTVVVKTEGHPPIPHERIDQHARTANTGGHPRVAGHEVPGGPGAGIPGDHGNHPSHSGPGGTTHRAGMPGGGPGSRRP